MKDNLFYPRSTDFKLKAFKNLNIYTVFLPTSLPLVQGKGSPTHLHPHPHSTFGRAELRKMRSNVVAKGTVSMSRALG